MKTILIALTAALGLASGWLMAQPSEQVAKSKMEIFKDWEGHWQGEGSIQMGPGEPSKSTVDEQVSFKLNGAILTVEGIGKATNKESNQEMVVHHAYGILSYDQVKDSYQFNSFLKDGRTTNAWFKPVAQNNFQWGFDVPNGMKMRYTIIIDPKKNTWHEIGEYSRDGSSWTKTFEMNLVRVQ